MRRAAGDPRTGLVVLSLLLAVLASAVYLTSTPTRGPARTWTT
ncbi:MAG: hypothetical protein Q7W30_06010 [Coriobacteriia bacterium]|nr:hypothetical protein [Coriobacteriia bacterium]